MAKTQTTISLAHAAEFEPHLTFRHVGTFDALAMVFDVESTSAETLLLPGLELAPQPVLPTGRHPLLLLAGEHRFVRSQSMPESLCPLFTPLHLCMHYLEVVLAVPFVRRRDRTTTFFACKSLHLDRMLPIFLGWLCAFPKQLARLSKGDDYFHLRTLGGAPLLEITISNNGSSGSASSFAHFTALRPMFELEHIGKLFTGNNSLVGDFVCTRCDLQLDDASLQAVSVQVAAQPAFSTVLPATNSFPGIDVDPLGAFRVKTEWILDPPSACP